MVLGQNASGRGRDLSTWACSTAAFLATSQGGGGRPPRGESSSAGGPGAPGAEARGAAAVERALAEELAGPDLGQRDTGALEPHAAADDDVEVARLVALPDDPLAGGGVDDPPPRQRPEAGEVDIAAHG